MESRQMPERRKSRLPGVVLLALALVAPLWAISYFRAEARIGRATARLMRLVEKHADESPVALGLAANRLGIAVPGRIAIAGFNDLAGSDQMVPPLTTIRTPRAEVGRAGAAMLLELMREPQAQPGCVQLDYELVVRQST